jgi:FAD/FMN-containing dehydrogenase
MQHLNDQVLEAIVDFGQRMPALGGLVQLRGLGGAMARVPADSTAFAHRDKAYLPAVIGGSVEPALYEQQRAWTEGLWRELRPHAAGVYVNFLEDEGRDRIAEAYAPATFERLRAIKRQYDPRNVFRLNQNIA